MGSRLVGPSTQGDANVVYSASDAFRFRPSVVRSEPRANVFRSGSAHDKQSHTRAGTDTSRQTTRHAHTDH